MIQYLVWSDIVHLKLVNESTTTKELSTTKLKAELKVQRQSPWAPCRTHWTPAFCLQLLTFSKDQLIWHYGICMV